MKDYHEVAQEILRRRDQYVQKRRRQRAAAFSFLCLAAALGFGGWQSGLWTENPRPSEHGVHYGEDASQSAPMEQTQPILLPDARFNSAAVDAFAGRQEIDLSGEDFVELSYLKLLDYYGVELSVETLFPELSRQEPAQGSYGIYQDPARGVYYDKNSLSFQNEDGTVTLDIAFSKAVHRPSGSLSLTGPTLEFTAVNGRRLALFRYTDEASVCYYAEFLQNGVGWYLGSAGMDEADFLRLLLAVAAPGDGAETHTVSGTVIAIDPYAGSMGVQPEDDLAGHQIRLPDTISPEDYALGDRVTVTYVGEPATIHTIWAEQLLDITKS